MRRIRKTLLALLIALIAGGGGVTLVSCGSLHSYWGVEGDYDLSDNGGRCKHHKHHKHKKPKKHHHHHHHDDDDDD